MNPHYEDMDKLQIAIKLEDPISVNVFSIPANKTKIFNMCVENIFYLLEKSLELNKKKKEIFFLLIIRRATRPIKTNKTFYLRKPL